MLKRQRKPTTGTLCRLHPMRAFWVKGNLMIVLHPMHRLVVPRETERMQFYDMRVVAD